MSKLIAPVGGRRFGTILMDPPWQFRTYDGKTPLPQRTPVAHYATMSADELKRLPVRMISAKDACLLMWAVDSHLDQAIDLGKSWGYEFGTIAFIWDKGDRIGMGKWTRKQAEICLLFTRGKPEPMSHAVRQIIRAPRREHSQKPDEQYARTEQLCRGPYLEMFSRTNRPGWTSWGDQAGRFGATSIEPPALIGLRRIPKR